MANETWPAGLPSPIVDGSNYQPSADNVLRTQFPGAIKARRRKSSSWEVVRFTLVLNRAQAQILDSFVRDTLKDVLSFDWIEFRDPARGAATYRFRARPTYQPVGTSRLWQASIELDLQTPFDGTFGITTMSGLLADEDDENLTT